MALVRGQAARILLMLGRPLMIALLAASLAVGASLQANAQQPISMGSQAPEPAGWTFNVAPYLWMATINGNLNFNLPAP
jgi:hypothetical protein